MDPNSIGLLDKNRLLPEPAKDFLDANILCRDLNIKTKEQLLNVCSKYIPLTLLGERQIIFIGYLGEDLGYDWK